MKFDVAFLFLFCFFTVFHASNSNTVSIYSNALTSLSIWEALPFYRHRQTNSGPSSLSSWVVCGHICSENTGFSGKVDGFLYILFSMRWNPTRMTSVIPIATMKTRVKTISKQSGCVLCSDTADPAARLDTFRELSISRSTGTRQQISSLVTSLWLETKQRVLNQVRAGWASSAHYKDRRRRGGVRTANANANAKLKTTSSPPSSVPVPSPVRPMSSDSRVEEVLSDPLPHRIPVGEVVGTFTHLREATEGLVVQIRQDVIEDVIWQLR